MKTVLTDDKGVILAIGDKAEQSPTEEDVILMNGCGYGIYGQKVYEDVDVPEEISPKIYSYDGTTFAPYTSNIERIRQNAIDDYTIELMKGGVI